MKPGLLSRAWARIGLLFALGVLIATVSAVSASAGVATRTCGVVVGQKWTLGPYSGDRYTVFVTGHVACGFAYIWTARVTREQGVHPLGPKGWTCSKSPMGGACSLHSSAHQFAWAIKR